MSLFKREQHVVEKDKKEYFENVPAPVVQYIFSFLDLKTLARVASVQKAWAPLSSSDALWKKHALSEGLNLTTDIKKKYAEYAKMEIYKNIYYVYGRVSGDPILKKYKFIENGILFSQLESCWDEVSSHTVGNPYSEGKIVVYKLLITDEQLEEMKLGDISSHARPAPVYSVNLPLTHTGLLPQIKTLEVDVLEVFHAPAIGGERQRVVIGANEPEQTAFPSIEIISMCSIS